MSPRAEQESGGSLPLAQSAVGQATTDQNGPAGGGANEPQRSIRVALSRLVINAGIGEALTRDPC